MWHMTRDMWHVTRDIWHVTYDTWHVTRDMQHVTCDMLWGETILSKFQLPSSSGLWFMIFWRFGGKGWFTHWLNESVNHKGFYKTAPATQGLLKKENYPRLPSQWARRPVIRLCGQSQSATGDLGDLTLTLTLSTTVRVTGLVTRLVTECLSHGACHGSRYTGLVTGLVTQGFSHGACHGCPHYPRAVWRYMVEFQ